MRRHFHSLYGISDSDSLKTVTYYSDTSSLRDQSAYSRYYNGLPDFRKQKADRFVFEKDRLLSVGVWLLLRRGLEDLGEDIDSLEFDETENGKPYIRNSDIRFNLSHSHDRVMCVLSDHDVGCDVEMISPIDMNVARRFFYGSEYDMILAETDPIRRHELFYRFWTLKESFMKATGLGFRLPLDSFRIDLGDAVTVEQHVDGSEYRFAEYDVNDGCRYAVCCRNGDIDGSMVHVDLDTTNVD